MVQKHRKRFVGHRTKFQERDLAEDEGGLNDPITRAVHSEMQGAGDSGTGREVAFERSKAYAQTEKENQERLAYEQRQENRLINKLKQTHTLVSGDPEPGEYTIVSSVGDKRLGTFEIGRMKFNRGGKIVAFAADIHAPTAPNPAGNRKERRANVEPKPKLQHPEHETLSSKHGNWIVTWDLPAKPTGRWTSLPAPNRIDFRHEDSGDWTVTYTWAKTSIERNALMHALNGNSGWLSHKEHNKLMHALNGNVVLFDCKTCNRSFHTRGQLKKVTCTKCKKPATFVKIVKTKAEEKTGPKGGKSGGKKTLVETAQKADAEKEAGKDDGVKEKEAEKLEPTTVTPEGHVIDMPDEEVVQPPTEFQPPQTLFTAHSSTAYSIPHCCAALLLTVASVCLFCFSHNVFGTMTAVGSLLSYLMGKSTYNYLRYDFENIRDEETIIDMRPDYMGHSKQKHQGRKAVYTVTATNESHLNQTLMDRFFNLFNFVFGVDAHRRGRLTIDVEVFSQISPSVKFVPAKHAIDRIDNSISRLATVNVDRHDSSPYLDQTLTLLKAYHWHYTALKIQDGHFSPYELIGTTRQ